MAKNQFQQPINLGQALKKLFLSSFVVITFVAYVVHQRFSNPDSALNQTAAPANLVAPRNNISSDDEGRVLQPAQSAPISQQPVTGNQILYKDGTYNGPQVDVYYGLVAVQVNVKNGKIANVNFLQYPSDRRTSQRINNIAMPYLQQEAIQAQSANVNIISGATLTSEGFMMSLDAALKTAITHS
ncbi:MAG: FMN-binding protein [Chloroflexota bacterium]